MPTAVDCGVLSVNLGKISCRRPPSMYGVFSRRVVESSTGTRIGLHAHRLQARESADIRRREQNSDVGSSTGGRPSPATAEPSSSSRILDRCCCQGWRSGGQPQTGRLARFYRGQESTEIKPPGGPLGMLLLAALGIKSINTISRDHVSIIT